MRLDFRKLFYLVALFATIVFFGISIMSFGAAFHNIDIAFNMVMVEDFHSAPAGTYTDCNSFNCQTASEAYSSGIFLYQIGMLFIIFSVGLFFLGFAGYGFYGKKS